MQWFEQETTVNNRRVYGLQRRFQSSTRNSSLNISKYCCQTILPESFSFSPSEASSVYRTEYHGHTVRFVPAGICLIAVHIIVACRHGRDGDAQQWHVPASVAYADISSVLIRSVSVSHTGHVDVGQHDCKSVCSSTDVVFAADFVPTSAPGDGLAAWPR